MSTFTKLLLGDCAISTPNFTIEDFSRPKAAITNRNCINKVKTGHYYDNGRPPSCSRTELLQFFRTGIYCQELKKSDMALT